MVLWQWLATIGCIILAHVFAPITHAEQWYADQGKEKLQQIKGTTDQAKDKLLNTAQKASEDVKKKTNGRSK